MIAISMLMVSSSSDMAPIATRLMLVIADDDDHRGAYTSQEF